MSSDMKSKKISMEKVDILDTLLKKKKSLSEQRESTIFPYGLVMMMIIFVLYNDSLLATIIIMLLVMFKTGIVICT